MSEPSWPAEGRLKAGCSQDWLPHKAYGIFIIRLRRPLSVTSNLCHSPFQRPERADEEYVRHQYTQREADYFEREATYSGHPT